MTDLPLTPATALLLANFVQDCTTQATVTGDGIIVPAAVPIAQEMADLHGVRAEAPCGGGCSR